MFVFLNGRIVPEEQAVVSVFDRSFLYGDGLFETLRVFNSQPFRWHQHWERLQHGAEFLNLKLPFPSAALRASAAELISRNRLPDSLLRLTLSRGVGIRGYSPTGAVHPHLVMSTHPAPETTEVGAHSPQIAPRWKLITSSFRLAAGERLAQFKTCNKLPQILACAEADAAGADEALLLNTDGFVVEAASSNLFWIDGDTVCTPPLASGILAGVTRAVVMEVCQTLGVPTREAVCTVAALKRSAGVFVSLSSRGVVEGSSLDGQPLIPSALVGRLRQFYLDLLRSETQ
jgi:branched-chain amino acid aminotransferase